MRVLFASGDVGGARALLPVTEVCLKNGVGAALLAHGHMDKEAPGYCEKVSPRDGSDGKQMARFFQDRDIRVLVFASSVKDKVPLTLARRAKDSGLAVIHVLDNWTAYRRRMEMDGLPVLVPDFYAVMDNFALTAAARDGVDPSTLVVTGQPALASLPIEYESWKKQDRRSAKRAGSESIHNKTHIVFVSEPVKNDQGTSPLLPQYRGYTEDMVLRLLCRALQPYAAVIDLGILPHPRENRDQIEECWNSSRGSLLGGLLSRDTGRENLFPADGVVGMASILLYEAWLIGKPVLSLQPGLRLEPLRMLEKRDGVIFIDSIESVSSTVAEWLASISKVTDVHLRSELLAHRDSPKNVFKLIETCLKRKC